MFDGRQALAGQRGRLVLWLPVFMGAGVLLYYDLRFEPPFWTGAAVALPAGLAAAGARSWLRPPLALLAAVGLGFAAAQAATARAPPLDRLPWHAVELTGRVGAVELLPTSRRVTLASVRLGNAPPLHRRLRIRLRDHDPAVFGAGDVIRLRALVRTPSPPSYPGGWDLQLAAFYSGLGGYGFAIGPVRVLARDPPRGLAGRLQRLREAIARRFRAGLPGAEGGIAATLLTGVQTAIPEPDRAAFRASGLAHLLAVAGLHIGIVMGLAFGATRAALALWEYAALRWPTKPIAAVVALGAGGFYMLLTGMHVPILRSFAMACLFTVAVIAGRRAISLRALAIAAVVLILIEPQEVPGVSFQMSFSAVLALIAGYEALRPHLHRLYGDGAWWRRAGLHVLALALTSLLAGTASAPFGAYHFGHVQLYFVIANMLAVPLAALWVMPAGLIALALMPFGLERLALVPMGWGIGAILAIARETALWPDAVLDVPHMPGWGLAVLALGMTWLGLWRGPLRLAGVAAIAAGLVSPVFARPPDLLVSADARMVAARDGDAVLLAARSGASRFARDAWRQYWGGRAWRALPSDGAPAGGAIMCHAGACRVRPRPGAATALLLLDDAAVPADCAGVAVVVRLGHARGGCPGVPLLGGQAARRDGAAAAWFGTKGVRIVTDRAERGERPWIPEQPAPGPSPRDLPLARAGP